MNIKYLKNLSLFVILVFILNGCATQQFSKKKGFKHNEPLIKEDIRKSGKASIEKTIEMGQLVGRHSEEKKYHHSKRLFINPR